MIGWFSGYLFEAFGPKLTYIWKLVPFYLSLHGLENCFHFLLKFWWKDYIFIHIYWSQIKVCYPHLLKVCLVINLDDGSMLYENRCLCGLYHAKSTYEVKLGQCDLRKYANFFGSFRSLKMPDTYVEIPTPRPISTGNPWHIYRKKSHLTHKMNRINTPVIRLPTM